jgi:hypothetical protein
MRTLVSIVVVSFFFNAVSMSAQGQVSHAVSQSVLDAAIHDHVATSAADRETVQRLLERPEVQAVAGDIGLDLRRAQSVVSTLDGQQLSTVAAQAAQVEQALAGGQSSITLSTTMIIIGLLLVILIVLIA